MGNLFGKEKPLKEVLRENKRMISKAIRELDRERTALGKCPFAPHPTPPPSSVLP